MIKLKDIIKESVWDRKFGDPLPTLEDVMKESDDDNYVHVGGGRYKEVNKATGEPLPNSPSYIKKDSGGYEMVDDDDPRLSDPEKPDDEPSDMDTERPDDEPEDEPAGKLGGGDFERDGWLVAEGTLSWEDFLARYGHLRPGTYEITSPSYSENPEKYLRPLVKARPIYSGTVPQEEIWDKATELNIREALDSVGLSITNEEFADFLRQAIEGREYSKFVFRRHLSTALDYLVQYGEKHGIDREQMSHIGIDQLMAFHAGVQIDERGQWLTEQANEGEKWHNLALAIDLPPLLLQDHNLLTYERHTSQPNFVTVNKVAAKVLELARAPANLPILDGLIVLIPQADPGFDWLFGHNISGIITMHGGANSHMTIRAAEFGLPAAIGVGQTLYEKLAIADTIELDCAAKWVRVLR